MIMNKKANAAERKVCTFQFPLYGIMIMNQKMISDAPPLKPFQFPLYGIMIMNFAYLRTHLSSTTAFNSRYMGL